MTICDAKYQTNRLFISMKNKTRHLRVRINEEQFNKLTEALIIKQRTKSSLIRDALNDYIDRNDNGSDKQNQKNNNG
jgi:hypothetical protein